MWGLWEGWGLWERWGGTRRDGGLLMYILLPIPNSEGNGELATGNSLLGFQGPMPNAPIPVYYNKSKIAIAYTIIFAPEGSNTQRVEIKRI